MKNQTRRDFLKRTISAIVAAPALPAIVASAGPGALTLGVDLAAPESASCLVLAQYANEGWVNFPHLASDATIDAMVDMVLDAVSSPRPGVVDTLDDPGYHPGPRSILGHLERF